MSKCPAVAPGLWELLELTVALLITNKTAAETLTTQLVFHVIESVPTNFEDFAFLTAYRFFTGGTG